MHPDALPADTAIRRRARPRGPTAPGLGGDVDRWRRIPMAFLARAVTTLLLCATRADAFDRSVRISAYQGPSHDGAFATNLTTARAVVGQAREAGSQFLVFPARFLSGGGSREAVVAGARPLDDPELASFVRESTNHSMVVVVGWARRSGTNLFDSVLVAQGGRILGVHDRVVVSPGDRERLGFSAGTAVPVFRAWGVMFGVMVGDDAVTPHVALADRLQGAELLFSLHHGTTAVDDVDEERRRIRNGHLGLAGQLGVGIVRVNVVRDVVDGDIAIADGDTFVLGPRGETLAEAGRTRTGLITADLGPEHFRRSGFGAGFQDVPPWLRTQLGTLWLDLREPRNESELGYWLTNLVVFHRFRNSEIASVTGLTPGEAEAAVVRLGLGRAAPPERRPGDPLRVLPYPGGRHPRLGFFEGAVAPQRETKVSVFTPWEGGGYVVVDVPEAIFSNLGLTYLAHTHIPTLWDRQGVKLPPIEWNRLPDGRLTMERTLPNGIAFGTEVRPEVEAVRFTLWLRNGTTSKLEGLRVQNCVMLGAASGFESLTLDNKTFREPLAVASSADGRRAVITRWERCGRSWGNERVPCIHSDPVFPDCAPNETVRLRGWLRFYEGDRLSEELERLSREP